MQTYLTRVYNNIIAGIWDSDGRGGWHDSSAARICNCVKLSAHGPAISLYTSTGAMAKIPYPAISTDPRTHSSASKNFRRLYTLASVLLWSSFLAISYFFVTTAHDFVRLQSVPRNAQELRAQCAQLRMSAGPAKDFHDRITSDRFEAGTPPTLIRNATIWTGGVSGFEVVRGDILIDRGLIQAIGDLDLTYLSSFSGFVTLDANGAWVTPG